MLKFASQQITEQQVESGCFCGRAVHSLDLNVRMIHGLFNRMIVEAFKWLHLRWPEDAMQTEHEYKIRLSHDHDSHTGMNSVMHGFEFPTKGYAHNEVTTVVHQWQWQSGEPLTYRGSYGAFLTVFMA